MIEINIGDLPLDLCFEMYENQNIEFEIFKVGKYIVMANLNKKEN